MMMLLVVVVIFIAAMMVIVNAIFIAIDIIIINNDINMELIDAGLWKDKHAECRWRYMMGLGLSGEDEVIPPWARDFEFAHDIEKKEGDSSVDDGDKTSLPP